MDAYDNHIIEHNGKETNTSDLNRPEKWSWLIQQSEFEGEMEDVGAGSKRKIKSPR